MVFLCKKTLVKYKNRINVFVEEGHANKEEWLQYLVHPIRAFWGDGTEEWEKWEKDFQYYKDYFTITDDILKSDIGFLPLTLNYYINNRKLGLVDNFAEKLKKFNKILIAWLDGDNDIRYRHKNCIIIKYSTNKNYNNSNVYIQPADLKNDLLNEYFNGKINIRNKDTIPSIGFDGMADYPKLKITGTIVKNIIHRLSYIIFQTQYVPDPIAPNLMKRKRILNYLKKKSSIKTDFKIRDSFAAGIYPENINARKEYVNNIISNDYTFCYRGTANYSLRLYETLCLGRIPLFIDTQCVLPLERKINWKEICLWVDQSELKFIDKKILDYHKSISNKEFIEKQIYCRELWNKYFSKHGFIKYFFRYLIKVKSKEIL